MVEPRIIAGDCVAAMASMAPASVDSIVTDPPYHFASIVKRYGKTSIDGAGTNEQRARDGSDQFIRASRGFMGKEWDGGDIAFRPETWAAALRVLKSGGHLVAFGAPKNYHRLACAIEDAGFEIRDSLMWVFGSGFPKSHNLHDEWEGWGTALKPAYEPIILARKPLIGTVAENVLAHGTGALNIDACRVGTEVLPAQRAGQAKLGTFERHDMVTPERTGRWPANLVHDGSEEVLAGFPHTASGTGAVKKATAAGHQNNAYGKESRPVGTPNIEYGDSGSAARFFYCAKAGKTDRAGSKHPTVKPIALMRWLVRLITPPGGVVLDPFAGSGTTGQAAMEEGFNAILIEREAEYLADIRRRISFAGRGRVKTKRNVIPESWRLDLE